MAEQSVNTLKPQSHTLCVCKYFDSELYPNKEVFKNTKDVVRGKFSGLGKRIQNRCIQLAWILVQKCSYKPHLNMDEVFENIRKELALVSHM